MSNQNLRVMSNMYQSNRIRYSGIQSAMASSGGSLFSSQPGPNRQEAVGGGDLSRVPPPRLLSKLIFLAFLEEEVLLLYLSTLPLPTVFLNSFLR